MTSSNLREQAKQGNLKAIALLLNRALKPKGMTIKLATKDECLRVVVEAEQVPPQQIAASLQKALLELGISSIHHLEIYGRQKGESIPSWRQKFSLTVPSTSSHSSVSSLMDNDVLSPSDEDNTQTPVAAEPTASTHSHDQLVASSHKFIVTPIYQTRSRWYQRKSSILAISLLACLALIGGSFALKLLYPPQLTQSNSPKQPLVDNPNSAEYWIQLGDMQLNTEDDAQALSAYDKATELDPQNAQAWTRRSVPLSRLGRIEEALATTDQSLRLDPNLADAWKDRCRVLQETQRLQDALTACDRALQINPKLDKAWLNRGVVFVLLGQSENARSSFAKASRINPQYAKAWLYQGHILAGMNRYAEAIAMYQKSARIDSTSRLAVNFRIVALDRWRWQQQAVFKRDRAAQTRIEQAAALYYRTPFLPAQMAIETLGKVVEINPNDYHAWNDQGVMYERLQQYDQAILAYNQAIQVNSRFGWAWYNRGVLLEKQGRYSEALSSYDQAIASGSFPAVEQARQNLLNRLGSQIK